jgi:hypothetical protein
MECHWIMMALNPSDMKYQVNYGDGTIKNYNQAQLESSVYYNAKPSASQNFLHHIHLQDLIVLLEILV